MRVLKFLGMGLGGVVLLLVGAASFILLRGPSIKPPSTEKVEATPERLVRGKYLVENVSSCFSCHAERDWKQYGAPVIPGTEGGPGPCETEETGAPGTICPSNITPHPEAGIGAWTDGEIIRAIREGVSRDGRPLFPMMPYGEYRSMSDEDVRSIVAYLRSLPPIARKAEPTRFILPMKIISQLLPKPVEGAVAMPAAGSPLYGEYLSTIGGCRPCHGSSPTAGDYIGGYEFSGPWGTVASSNLTPDPETGIGSLTREAFIGRFKAHAEIAPGAALQPGTGTPMPWIGFAGMSEGDLGAIHDYLRTLKPVRNAIAKRPAAP